MSENEGENPPDQPPPQEPETPDKTADTPPSPKPSEKEPPDDKKKEGQDDKKKETPQKSPEAETASKPEPVKFSQDPLHTEFLYYSSVLRILGPTMTNENDRRLIIPWVKKLFRPEYHSSKLREKRNRYLAYLATSLLMDEAIGVFREYPPEGAIPDLQNLVAERVEAAEWETDPTWQDTLVGLPEDFQMLDCCVHATPAECKDDHKLDKILDQEFLLFIYIARPYAFLISNGNDRTRVASWMQMLCSIHGPESCSSMKAIRNDYMMALLGYLQDLRSVGPFADLPSWKTLQPLAEAAKAAAENKPILDPTGTEANEFLMNQPMPDDGAFCYIALTGDLVSTNLNTD